MTLARSRPFLGGLLGLAAALLAAPLPAQAEPTKHPFLWKIEGAGEVPSWLYGTMHVADPRVTALPDEVWLAILDSDALYTELPMNAGMVIQTLGEVFLPPGTTLEDVLPAELYERLAAFLRKKGMPIRAFRGMKPWVLNMTLELQGLGPDPGSGEEAFDPSTLMALDGKLYNIALEEGKDVGGVETVEEQVAVFDSLSFEEQAEMLRKTLERLEGGAAPESGMEHMIQVYLSGDEEEAMRVFFGDPEEETPTARRLRIELLDKRNVRMADRAAALMEEHPERGFFFAFGAGHMPGPAGVVELLRKKGYRVTRIAAPPPQEPPEWVLEHARPWDFHEAGPLDGLLQERFLVFADATLGSLLAAGSVQEFARDSAAASGEETVLLVLREIPPASVPRAAPGLRIVRLLGDEDLIQAALERELARSGGQVLLWGPPRKAVDTAAGRGRTLLFTAWTGLDGREEKLAPAPRDSLEAVLHRLGAEAVAADLSNAGDRPPLRVRDPLSPGGFLRLRPGQEIHGVLLVERASPPARALVPTAER